MTRVQYFSKQTLFVNCNVRKKETAKSAICNSSSSIITGNVIRFDNNFLFFGNFFVKLKDQNTSKFFANHLRRGGRFCEISSKVAKYKRIQGECCCCKDYWRNSLFYYYYTIFFFIDAIFIIQMWSKGFQKILMLHLLHDLQSYSHNHNLQKFVIYTT